MATKRQRKLARIIAVRNERRVIRATTGVARNINGVGGNILDGDAATIFERVGFVLNVVVCVDGVVGAGCFVAISGGDLAGHVHGLGVSIHWWLHG